MDFDLSDDRRMLADMLKRFVAEQYGYPVRERAAASPLGYDAGIWSRYAELGAIAALFDEAHGGLGGGGHDIAVVFENLGRGLAVEPLLGALMAGSAIAQAGSDDQRRYLEPLIAGQLVAALTHAEPDTHYETTLVRTRAVRDGQDWVLDGAKAVVEQGEACDLFVVSARCDGDDDSEQGLCLFLLPQDTPGLQRRGYPLIDGGRAAELRLEGVRLGPGALLGQAGAALATLEHALGRGVLALCAEAIGAMDAARDATVEYLGTRQQFGVPIGRFQALQHRMADLLLEIEQARSSVINAAALLDHSERVVRERALSAAKATVGRVGTLVAEEAIQLHGGIGMTWELPLAHHAKRLVMIDHQLGDEDHHLQRYIALGRSA